MEISIYFVQAVRLLEEKRLKNEQEEEKWKAVLLKLYLNQSLCSLRQGKPKLAITQCRKVIDFDQKNVKAYFRLGQVRIASSGIHSAAVFKIRYSVLQFCCPLETVNGQWLLRVKWVRLSRTATNSLHTCKHCLPQPR